MKTMFSHKTQTLCFPNVLSPGESVNFFKVSRKNNKKKDMRRKRKMIFFLKTFIFTKMFVI
ncbi:MAG: hypothetical protein FMNOHCHN_00031 [Ignavibacteriaceae bacterium]|nr:hypothetical protein [Ignavibacteriaceae bacterium]